MKQARNLWPIGVITAIGIFICGTVALIVLACSQKVELVSSDYYEQEVGFQEQMDRIARTRRLGTQASVAYDCGKKSINVSLPTGQVREIVSGLIQLYRPSAAGLDRQFKLQPDANGVQQIDAAGLAPGLWKVRISWKVRDQEYFIDQAVVVGNTAKPWTT